MTINSAQPDFEKGQQLSAIVQDAQTGKVLMLGYMDKAAFEKTLQEKVVTFFSRSKNRLWTKGETSGNFLRVTEMTLDCDQDTLLLKVDPVGRFATPDRIRASAKPTHRRIFYTSSSEFTNAATIPQKALTPLPFFRRASIKLHKK